MPTMELTAELVLWNLVTHSANQLSVVFFDPFESDFLMDMAQ